MNNSTIDIILNRRSVRQYADQSISEADLQTIIQCGLHAPSSRNRQNWHFTVITNKALIDTINQMTLEGMERLGIEKEPGSHIFYHAPLVIVLSSMIEGFSQLNAGCAVENMALAAKALGLDSCIIGQTKYLYHKASTVDINRMLKIPEGYEHDVSICFGYRLGEEPVVKPRKEDLVDYIR